MSQAGKAVLPVLVFLLTLGASQPLHAQEKLLPITVGLGKTNQCTPLEDILIAKNQNCYDRQFSQIEASIKAESPVNTDPAVEFSYSTEPTYYVPPTPSVTPTETPTPTSPALAPETTSQSPKDNIPADAPSLDSNLIFTLINAHRAEIGKPAFQKDDALCTLAKTRSIELHDELFVNHNLHSGLYNRNLPYWITENAKWGSNEAGTVDWWLHSPIHRAAIEGDYIYSCGACNGTQCSQLFTSYTPKQ